MKIGIVCALALVALINGSNGRSLDLEDIQLCKPGDTKLDDGGCNNCFCIADGSGWACTKMMCLPFAYVIPNVTVDHSEENNQNAHRATRGIGFSFTCTPNETFMDNCNHCFCSPDGHSAGCTLMACPPKDDSRKTS